MSLPVADEAKLLASPTQDAGERCHRPATRPTTMRISPTTIATGAKTCIIPALISLEDAVPAGVFLQPKYPMMPKAKTKAPDAATPISAAALQRLRAARPIHQMLVERLGAEKWPSSLASPTETPATGVSQATRKGTEGSYQQFVSRATLSA